MHVSLRPAEERHRGCHLAHTPSRAGIFHLPLPGRGDTETYHRAVFFSGRLHGHSCGIRTTPFYLPLHFFQRRKHGTNDPHRLRRRAIQSTSKRVVSLSRERHLGVILLKHQKQPNLPMMTSPVAVVIMIAPCVYRAHRLLRLPVLCNVVFVARPGPHPQFVGAIFSSTSYIPLGLRAWFRRLRRAQYPWILGETHFLVLSAPRKRGYSGGCS